MSLVRKVGCCIYLDGGTYQWVSSLNQNHDTQSACQCQFGQRFARPDNTKRESSKMAGRAMFLVCIWYAKELTFLARYSDDFVAFLVVSVKFSKVPELMWCKY